ncbi:hypothetical protein G7068_03970 [Leucobacter viscericola]|uniref:Host cell surface-exposed lipoprotein n=1 Tax=Leucobacter viscericola TaxID=2714935 RepID=A0A6G7XD81_9MICO|nr:hypothetical protein [Leucobacter viscericola]QIK62462.1 hypothetical protein G7068_03970 [Leucobacter viscericola]
MNLKPITRFAAPAVLVAAALALSGCSSGDSKAKTPEEGPLQKYMSALYGSEQYNQEFYDKQHAKAEESIAKCMAKEGFEYKPNPQGGSVFIPSGDEEEGSEEEQWGTLKFAETYGYGIVDSSFMNGLMGGGEEGGEEQWVDPNQKYIESLSESEQSAYYETLLGAQQSSVEIVEAGQESGWDSNVVGCQAAAQHETEGEDAYRAASEDPEFADLFVKMQDVYSTMLGEDGKPSNDVLIKLDRDWAACMVKDGYDFENPMAANNFMQDEWGRTQGFSVERSASGSSSTIEEGDEPKELSKKEKEKFQEKEINTAVADWRCQDKVDYKGTQQRLSNEVEQKFVDENKAKLDAMLAKYGTKKQEK